MSGSLNEILLFSATPIVLGIVVLALGMNASLLIDHLIGRANLERVAHHLNGCETDLSLLMPRASVAHVKGALVHAIPGVFEPLHRVVALTDFYDTRLADLKVEIERRTVSAGIAIIIIGIIGMLATPISVGAAAAAAREEDTHLVAFIIESMRFATHAIPYAMVVVISVSLILFVSHEHKRRFRQIIETIGNHRP